MRIQNILLVLLPLLLAFAKVDAQELNLDVRLNTPALKIADPKVFRTLETAIKEFMNNTSWDDDEFDDLEKIEGSLQINITEEKSSNTFVADFYITASRPVYGSNYYSTLFKHVDRSITFSYEEFQPFFNNKNNFSDNFSAILTYYAYVIMGFDYDSFSAFGGDKYFQIANNLVATIPRNVSSADSGWGSKSLGDARNRYTLMANLFNPRVRPFRRAYYEYHRQGLDLMGKNSEKAKLALLASLKTIGDVNKALPDSMLLQMFSNSKKQEIMDVFVPSSRGDRLKVYDIMTQLSPSQVSEFSDLR